MSNSVTRLADVLIEPSKLTKIPLSSVSEVISEARYHSMLSQLSYICKQRDCWDELPQKLKEHLTASEHAYVNQKAQLQFEAEEFSCLLSPLGINWVYLKGSAYHLADMSEFRGRMMADIDILVSEQDLPLVESTLASNGWVQSHVNDYDDKFYREWSQEIPPLHHFERRTELDLHFNILPKTIQQSPNSEVLVENSLTLEPGSQKEKGARILSPEAMAIHSSVHLFYESEFHKGFRDLYDLYLQIGRAHV